MYHDMYIGYDNLHVLPRSIKKTDLFFKKIAPYASSKIKNYKRSKKLLKRRFIWDQEQVSSFIRLEVIKKRRDEGQNSQLQKMSISRRFLLVWVIFVLTKFLDSLSYKFLLGLKSCLFELPVQLCFEWISNV